MKIRAFGAALILAAVGSFGIAAPAAGADSLSVESNGSGTTQVVEGELTTLTIEPSSPTSNEEAGATLASTISCTVTTDHPHGSTHVSGTVNVVSKVACTAPVSRIRSATELARVDPYQRWVGIPKVKTGVKTLKSSASTSCNYAPADFAGVGFATITPPPGYVLHGSPNVTKFGETERATCGSRAASVASGEEAAETITVTFAPAGLAS